MRWLQITDGEIMFSCHSSVHLSIFHLLTPILHNEIAFYSVDGVQLNLPQIFV